MKNGKRISASYVRKFLPGLRRVRTEQNGLRWTVNGKDRFHSLQEVINAYGEHAHELAEAMKDTKEELAKVMNAGAIKEEAMQ